MIPCLVHVQPLNPATGTRVSVRVGSSLNPVHLGIGSVVWEPAFVERPIVSQRLVDDNLTGNIPAAEVRMTLAVSQLTEWGDKVTKLQWAGAPLTVHIPDTDTTAEDWVVAEVVDHMYMPDSNRLRITAVVSTEFLSRPLLKSTYLGTGGVEGTQAQRGMSKPFGWGFCENIPPELIDPTESVYMVSGYSNVLAITNLYEDGAPFGPPVGDYADYASLMAAAIPAGRWAYSRNAGVLRLGAPPAGVITADVEFQQTLPGDVVSMLLQTMAGVPVGKVNLDSLTALNAACPRSTRFWTKEDVQVGSLVQRLVQSCNWTAFVNTRGIFEVARCLPNDIANEYLITDGSGDLEVTRSAPQSPTIPYHKIAMSAAYNYYVHDRDQIRFGGRFSERGEWSPAETYREGDIVLFSGSSWLFITSATLTGTPQPGTTAAQGIWVQLQGGEVLRLDATPGGFVYGSDGLPDPRAQNITFIATVPSGQTVSWMTNPPVMLTGSANDTARQMTVSDFGNNQSVVVTAQTDTQQVSRTIYRQVKVRHRVGLLAGRPTVGDFVGDLYTTTDEGAVNTTYYWNGSAWIEMASYGATSEQLGQIAAALEAAENAGAVADGTLDIFYEPTTPASAATGDLWFDTDDRKWYRFSGTAWALMEDAGIGTALSAAAGAQATADGRVRTYYSNTTPNPTPPPAPGDLWYNPDINQLKRWGGTSWSAAIANYGATPEQVADINAALAQAGAAGDSVIELFYQTTAPTGSERDLWFDTDDRKWYSYTGGAWVLREDAGVGAAITAAAGAQATADGKVKSFIGDTAPVPSGVGDLWYQTSTKILYRWSGSGWGTTATNGATFGDYFGNGGNVMGSITPGNVGNYVGAGAIGNLQIGNEIFSSNFVPNTSGWIIRKSGTPIAEFNGVVISRNQIYAQGRLDPAMTYPPDFGYGEWEHCNYIIDTGVTTEAWGDSRGPMMVNVFVNSPVYGYATAPSQNYWGAEAGPLFVHVPWEGGAATLRFRLRVYGRHITGFPGGLTYIIYKVT